MATTEVLPPPEGTAKKKRRGRNLGSVYEEYPGKFRAQVSLKGKRISEYFPTKTAANKWIRMTLTNIEEKGLTYDAYKQTVGVYMTNWLKLQERSLKPNVFPSYKRYVEHDIIPALGERKLHDLTATTINSFYSDLRDADYGDRTIQYIHQVLSSAMTQAINERTLILNPMAGVVEPKYEAGEMLILDIEQVHSFLTAAKEHPKLEALYDLAVKYGIRQAELLGLRWTDIDFDRGTLFIQRQMHRVNRKIIFTTPKTKTSRRIIPIGQTTIKLLLAHRERQNVVIAELERKQSEAKEKGVERKRVWKNYGLVFASSVGTPWDQRNLKNDFWAVLKEAGIERFRKIMVMDEDGNEVDLVQTFRFHDLRHTAASMMIHNSPLTPMIVISRILGHSKVSITLDVYGHLMSNSQRNLVEEIDALMTPIPVGEKFLSEIDKN